MAATPKVVTDGSSDLDEGVLNLFLNALKSQVKINFFLVQIVEATNVATIETAFSNDGEVVDADVTYDGAGELLITLTGFSTKPLVYAIIGGGTAATNTPILTSGANSNVQAVIETRDTSMVITDIDDDIDILVLILGY